MRALSPPSTPRKVNGVGGRARNLERRITTPGGKLLQTYSVPGALSTLTGTERWYPVASGSIVKVHVAAGTAPTGSGITVRIKLNGTSVGTVTIAAGSNTNSFVPTTTAFVGADTDYFTIDITAVGSTTPGTDLVVQFEGSYS